MRPMDCLRESYSFTLYAQVTLEELMPCKVANQIAPVISKHSIWFIRIINTGQEKKKGSAESRILHCGQPEKYILHLTSD